MERVESGRDTEFAPSWKLGHQLFTRQIVLIQTGDFGRVLTGTGLGLSHGIRHMNGGHGTESGSLVVVRMVVIGHRFHNAVAESLF